MEWETNLGAKMTAWRFCPKHNVSDNVNFSLDYDEQLNPSSIELIFP